MRDSEFIPELAVGTCVAWIVIIALIGGLWGCPKYNVYKSRLAGEAELAQASYNRQIKVQEAHSTMEAAASLSEAEVRRAEGVARANKIIGSSLQNNEAYLKYLWIHQIGETKDQIIYIPTESSLPILEATRTVNKENK
jgi:hypothetical protein